MTTTAYLDLFLRSISEPALLQTFLSFILLHNHDSVQVLDTLVSRVNTPFQVQRLSHRLPVPTAAVSGSAVTRLSVSRQLGTVSLALFRTLIGLFCEDVMLQLVFRSVAPKVCVSRFNNDFYV